MVSVGVSVLVGARLAVGVVVAARVSVGETVAVGDGGRAVNVGEALAVAIIGISVRVGVGVAVGRLPIPANTPEPQNNKMKSNSMVGTPNHTQRREVVGVGKGRVGRKTLVLM